MKKFSIKQIPTSVLVLAIIAVMLIVWGSYQYSLGNISKNIGDVVLVEDGVTDGSNEGKYVLANGKLTPDNTITDPATGVSVNGLAMFREVEMYQYGITGPETVSEGFFRGQNYNIVGDGGEQFTNPVLPENLQDDVSFYANVTLSGGNLVVNERYIKALVKNSYKADFPMVECGTYAVTEIDESALANGFRLVDGYITNADLNDPKLGDIRISYSYIPCTTDEVSVFGRQEDSVVGKDDDDYSFIAIGVDTVEKADELMFGSYRSAAKGMYLIAAVLLIIAGVKLAVTIKKERV